MRPALTLLLTLLLAGPAAAAGPLPPIDLAGPADGSQNTGDCVGFLAQPGIGGVDVATNAAGDAVATWTRSDGVGRQVVQAAIRSAGGRFGPAETLGAVPPCYDIGVLGAKPEAGIDAAGNVVVAFLAPAASGTASVRAARRPAGGGFLPATTLSAASNRIRDPRLAMNEAGATVVVWEADQVVQASIGTSRAPLPTGSDLSNPLLDSASPDVAVNAAGAVGVAWSGAQVIEARVRPAGTAAFVTTQQLVTGGGANPSVGIDASGRVTAAWTRGTVAEARPLSPQGVIAEPVDAVSEPGETARSSVLAVDRDGRAVAAYLDCPSQTCTVKVADRAPDGRFGTPEVVTPPVSDQSTLDVAAGGNGGAALTVAPFASAERALVTSRVRGGAFGDVVPISPAGAGAFVPQVAVDGEGNVVAGWTKGSGPFSAGKIAQVAAIDAAGPAITALDVPATVQAGAPARMTAAAADRWSGAALAWDFGDGATARGGAVAHAFAAGTHTVTLTATDGAGNVTRAARTLRVTAPPPAPEPEVITSTVFTRWAFKGKRLVLLSMRVARPPARATVSVRCRGRKCPFRSRTVKRRAEDAGQLKVVKTLSIRRALDVRARRFRAGQRVQVRITAPGAVGRVVTFKLKAGREPRGRAACLPPGARTPEACPQ